MIINDFLCFDMEKVSVNANEGDDCRWRVEIIDKDGNKVNLPWVQLEYLVGNISRYVNQQISKPTVEAKS